ncbi:MAG: type 4a pilus biogenesis protein PilO [Sulfurimonas sp.]|uniref:type 4a pilus biogenesis protein PilO n=1 Tax=Sulfurimonas sp. TaxID=2022749 RepID=UPI0025FF6910|nr:type 4a pilus biogenesis protein PilO [Sulfurimonas sp.]MCK9491030.1 type 4a pilus biogenesis protein PilO [Sulfurimonas sp.]
MKINIEDYLQSIDASFKNKSQKDIYMTYIMVFGVIFAFSYLLFWDSSEAAFKETNKQINQITSKINADKAYLQVNPESKIASLDLEIKKLNNNLEIHKNNNAYIKSKIETISSLIYDERTWGEYLHSISTNAKKYGIKIVDFTNEYAKTDKSFGHILDIELKTTAKYTNTLRFINSLEQSELVVDIHKVKIKANERLDTDLSISVWGITY